MDDYVISSTSHKKTSSRDKNKPSISRLLPSQYQNSNSDRKTNKQSQDKYNIVLSTKKQVIVSKKDIIKKAYGVLISKHNSNEETLNNAYFEALIYNKNCHLVSMFKDSMIFDYVEEFLKRFYNLCESIERIPKIVKYYKNYLKFFCNPLFRDFKINGVIQSFGDNKAKVYYKRNYGTHENDGNDGTSQNNIEVQVELENIFSDTIKDNINHNSITQTICNSLLDDYNTVTDSGLKQMEYNKGGSSYNTKNDKIFIVDEDEDLFAEKCQSYRFETQTAKSYEESLINIVANLDGVTINNRISSKKQKVTNITKTYSTTDKSKTTVKSNNKCEEMLRLLTKKNKEQLIKEYENKIKELKSDSIIKSSTARTIHSKSKSPNITQRKGINFIQSQGSAVENTKQTTFDKVNANNKANNAIAVGFRLKNVIQCYRNSGSETKNLGTKIDSRDMNMNTRCKSNKKIGGGSSSNRIETAQTPKPQQPLNIKDLEPTEINSKVYTEIYNKTNETGGVENQNTVRSLTSHPKKLIMHTKSCSSILTNNLQTYNPCYTLQSLNRFDNIKPITTHKNLIHTNEATITKIYNQFSVFKRKNNSSLSLNKKTNTKRITSSVSPHSNTRITSVQSKLDVKDLKSSCTSKQTNDTLSQKGSFNQKKFLTNSGGSGTISSISRRISSNSPSMHNVKSNQAIKLDNFISPKSTTSTSVKSSSATATNKRVNSQNFHQSPIPIKTKLEDYHKLSIKTNTPKPSDILIFGYSNSTKNSQKLSTTKSISDVYGKKDSLSSPRVKEERKIRWDKSEKDIHACLGSKSPLEKITGQYNNLVNTQREKLFDNLFFKKNDFITKTKKDIDQKIEMHQRPNLKSPKINNFIKSSKNSTFSPIEVGIKKR